MRKVRKSPNPKVRGHGPEQGHEAVERPRHRLPGAVHDARTHHDDRRRGGTADRGDRQLQRAGDDPDGIPLVLDLYQGPAPRIRAEAHGKSPSCRHSPLTETEAGTDLSEPATPLQL